MSEKTPKRKSKDSVFVNLFSDVNYVYKFYKERHPEDTETTAEDIEILTLNSVLVNTIYNDLGFVVGNCLLFLVEAQSKWDPNIALKILFYLVESYHSYLDKTWQDYHNDKIVKLPKPELYVIYSGDKQVPSEISFSDEYFSGSSAIDLKINVISTETAETLSGQYIGFCKVFDEQRKIHSNKLECIKEAIRICIEKGYLVPYLKEHESEVVTMMNELFDEEYLRKQYDKYLREQYLAEGKAEGEARGKAEATKIFIDNLRKMGLSEDQIKMATGM